MFLNGKIIFGKTI